MTEMNRRQMLFTTASLAAAAALPAALVTKKALAAPVAPTGLLEGPGDILFTQGEAEWDPSYALGRLFIPAPGDYSMPFRVLMVRPEMFPSDIRLVDDITSSRRSSPPANYLMHCLGCWHANYRERGVTLRLILPTKERDRWLDKIKSQVVPVFGHVWGQSPIGGIGPTYESTDTLYAWQGYNRYAVWAWGRVIKTLMIGQEPYTFMRAELGLKLAPLAAGEEMPRRLRQRQRFATAIASDRVMPMQLVAVP